MRTQGNANPRRPSGVRPPETGDQPRAALLRQQRIQDRHRRPRFAHFKIALLPARRTGARERIGFPDATTHRFRKKLAKALDRADLSARSVAASLRHASPSMTQDVDMTTSSESKRAADPAMSN